MLLRDNIDLNMTDSFDSGIDLENEIVSEEAEKSEITTDDDMILNDNIEINLINENNSTEKLITNDFTIKLNSTVEKKVDPSTVSSVIQSPEQAYNKVSFISFLYINLINIINNKIFASF